MATSGGDPQRKKTTSLQGGVSGSRGGAQSVLVRPEKERWSSFPMGQRLMGSYKTSSSSFLLQQIIHRYPESDPEQEESESEGEGEEEELMDSEESSESELLNLEGEFDGVLREEAVAEALYQLGRSGSGTEQVFLNLTLSVSVTRSPLPGYILTWSWYIDNAIEEISGLELCSSLTHLSLAKNKITTISGLGELPIKILCLIAELGEIEYIENLPLLRILNLLKNPIQEQCEYWFFVIFMLLRLTELDQKKITVEEKVLAVNKYNPPPEVVAAQDHLTHVVHSVMQPQRIFDSTLPSLDAPYPMLVLAGPVACGKRELAHRLCRQFSTYFR
ncbi:hypothetical protein QTO34_004706 [Cnephaeus nilssonii]|uniref:Leucine-rich repeat and guanylate kinase domain-containing protein n=1 Tax=Cnephaeus nilssonii TaxID=3371016 RepID=A0AA40HPR2_CNENI|nr:hypothetical protein QTO34_004706 [Eptesicus nilssonii]